MLEKMVLEGVLERGGRLENAMKKRSIKIIDNYQIRPFRILRNWGSALMLIG